MEGETAQCHIVFPKLRILRKLWGGPRRPRSRGTAPRLILIQAIRQLTDDDFDTRLFRASLVEAAEAEAWEVAVLASA
jgi:hypothetical protein